MVARLGPGSSLGSLLTDPLRVLDHRKGAPQSHHAHGLLPRGHEIIGRLFPGIEDDLRTEGGTAVRDAVGFMVVSPAGPLPVRPISAEFVMFSRFLLEWQIRRRLARLPQVRFLPGAEVVGLDSRRRTGCGIWATARCRRKW